MAQSSGRCVRVGTRGSPLALAQAEAVRRQLAAALGWPEDAIEIAVIRTSGDAIQDRPLAEAGGKGLFTKEIEEALLEGRIDMAVHSAKDMPTLLPRGLVLAGCLEREDVRDAFISRRAIHPRDLPPGSIVGSASLRRQAQIKRLRPDLVVTTLRGNIGTRIKKLEAGEVDATLLALAGLKRLALEAAATTVLPVEEFLPAVGQGAIAIETRADDDHIRAIVAKVDHPATTEALSSERAFLGELDGSCRTPIAGHASIRNGELHFRGMILKPDGSETQETFRVGMPSDAVRLGVEAACELKRRASAGFFEAG